ncbi:MAG: polysaccharide deacetylase family protein [Bacteroidales bacterium]
MVNKERLAAKIFRDLTWHFAEKGNELYLTFDDGPTPDITVWVLSVLKEYQAKATFFCLGCQVEKHPKLYQQIVDEGHAVGNHSYSHLNGWLSGNQKYYSDVKKASEFISSKLFRPPYGKISPLQLKHLKKEYQIIMWDVLSYDYHPKTSPQKCLKNIINHARPGSIIVFHDNKKAEKNLKAILPEILEYYSSRGFVFKSIDPSI